MIVYFQKLNEDAILPTRGSAQAAGWDLYTTHSGVIHPGQTMLFKTGLIMMMNPEDHEQLALGNIDYALVAKVCSRSGMALKNSVFVLNAPGIIDQDYRGEIGVILHNAGDQSFAIDKGMRVAQLLIEFVFAPQIVDVQELPATARGVGGFGSTDQ